MIVVESDPKAPSSIATTGRYWGGQDPFPGLPHFNLDPYLIMVSVKQSGIKYHFFSLLYDPLKNWTQVSRVTGEKDSKIFLKQDYYWR